MIFMFAALVSLVADDRVPHAQDRPPGPPLSPAEALAKFKTPPGFKVELFAAEPDVVNPVAMTFDARGRIWITESLEYPRRSPGPGRDRIKILEDTDGDGKADKTTIFAEGLNIPSGIALGYGGAFVANSPDLLFLQDTDGDDKADKREVLLTGFGRDDTHELPSAFVWGPDGWLYGLNGVFNYSTVVHQGKKHQFTCAVWRYHPKSKKFELFCEGTSNPWGLDYNANGDFFVSACVIDHLWHLTESGYYHRQAGAYPPYTWKIDSIVDYKHQKAAYCGLCYYDAEAYPAEYRGTLFMGNIHGNCINNDSLAKHGASYKGGSRPDLVSIDDAWFMPVVQKVGPDGCLWIVDWYDRYHCYQDANRDPAGIDRLKGRIYRVTYNGTPAYKPFDLAKASDAELTKALEDPNIWKRRTARQLLIERGREASLGNREALWTAVSQGKLPEVEHTKLLGADNPADRAWAVRAAGEMGDKLSPQVRRTLLRMFATEKHPDVRLQLAIAAPKIEGVDAMPLLLSILATADDDPSGLVGRIVWRNLQPVLDRRVADFVVWLEGRRVEESPVLREILPRVVERTLATAKRHPQDTAPILGYLMSSADRIVAANGMSKLLDALLANELPKETIQEVRTKFGAALGRLAASADLGDVRVVPAAALAAYFDPKMPAADAVLRKIWTAGPNGGYARDRSAAPILRALAARDAALANDYALTSLMAARTQPNEQREMLALLAKVGDAKSAEFLVGAWRTVPPEVAPQVVDALSARKDWSRLLVAAVESKKIPTAAVNANQIRRMTQFGDSELAERVTAVWGQVREGRNPNRERLAAEFLAHVQRSPQGDPALGAKVFEKVCAQCHQFKGKGVAVGPKLDDNGRTGLPLLVSNVVDPNLVIGKDYQARLVAVDDGRTLTGLVVEDSPTRVVLKLAGDKQEIVPKANIERMKVSDVSMMPEDVEKQMTKDEFRHLMAYLLKP